MDENSNFCNDIITEFCTLCENNTESFQENQTQSKRAHLHYVNGM